ncbi:hypothetical protein ELQ90_11860 [Labedella phragmitis]|uniref:Uncharacterized protein n=1 Tax=Labedella phragmitis TaxID=2498849 RepID=A0A444PRX6_9MICO|nr:hypothetical protein [Labedella phragmitis]RWZ50033.1 hypothetical protein ELQ90_11860 [Labedella phragmitis]
MTIIIGMVLMIFVATATAVAVSGTRKSSHDADWSAAIAAAYAGVDDYQSRLSNDTSYSRYGNPHAAFSSTSTLVLPAQENPAFGIGTTGTWASVPGSSNGAQYRYEVDNSSYATAGSLRIRSSGRVGDSVRSIVVNVKQKGFVDYLYYTDFEMTDPILRPNSWCPLTYAHQLPGNTHASGCQNIQFAANDVINGPFHSKDTVLTCGATRFNGTFTTENRIAPLYKRSTASGCSGSPVFAVAPKHSDAPKMPESNAEMLRETRGDLMSSTVPRPGCLYSGPTIITFTADGMMNVKSPFTRATRTSGSPASGAVVNTDCGTPGNQTGQLGSLDGATIPVIDQNLIYVQNVPNQAGNPNIPISTTASNFTCSSSGNQWTFGTEKHPAANEQVPYASPAHYGCRNGDLYVKGVLDGRVTLAAQNYIYVTGDLTYESASDDVLGLVGENSVWVHKPVYCSVWNKDEYGRNTTCRTYANISTTKDRRIDAAILSVLHTFIVQNYDRGASFGTLTVMGSIAQKFRGPVATTDGAGGVQSGYLKNYSYDPRFKYLAPPKFLSPATTTYGVSEIVEVKSAFKPDGSPA